jgi:hypothetical protein
MRWSLRVHQEIDMTIRDFETNLASDDISLLSDDELEAASGGLSWLDIHMPYGDFNKMPINAPGPTRYC